MKLKPLEAIRVLSGIFSQNEAIERLALINLIVRAMEGDAEKDFTKKTVLEVTKIELDLD